MTRDEKLELIETLAEEFADWALTNVPAIPSEVPYSAHYLNASKEWQAKVELLTFHAEVVAILLGFDFGPMTLGELAHARTFTDANLDPTPYYQHEVTEGSDVSEPLPSSSFPQ